MAEDTLKTQLNSSPCTIGELTLDLLLQEDEELSNKVTQFPVENGSPATDHVINEPVTLTITGYVTNAPIRVHPGTVDSQARVTRQGEDKLVGPDINFAELALAYLKKIRLERKAVRVTTKRGTWENMLIQRISRTKTKATGDALVFTITLVEFRQVKLLFVAGTRKRTTSARAQPRSQGGKKSTPKPPKDYGSIWYNLDDGIDNSGIGNAVKTFFTKKP